MSVVAKRDKIPASRASRPPNAGDAATLLRRTGDYIGAGKKPLTGKISAFAKAGHLLVTALRILFSSLCWIDLVLRP